MKKKRILPIIMLMCSVLLCACNHNRKSMKNEYAEKDGEKEYAESTDREADTDRQIETPSGYPSMPYGNKEEKGYDLPIDARQRAEAEEDCKEMMGFLLELYKNADKGCASNVVIADEVIDQMMEKLKATGCPVTITEIYSNMENYTKLEDFLNAAVAGSGGSAVNNDGKKDIIIICYYFSGAGPTGMVPRPDIRIFIAEENEFYLAEDMVTDIEQHILAKDITIESVCNYLKNNN